MIIALAGLPGTGKTTLAHQLVRHIPGALLLSKDRLRYALFGTEHTTYTCDQDDHCVQTLFATAVWQWRHAPATTVVLDGRTWLRAGQLQQLRGFAAEHRQPLLLLECVCRADICHARLAEDHRRGRHPAGNRTPALHQALAAAAEPITGPKLLLDTQQPVTANIETVLRHLATHTASDIACPASGDTVLEVS
jgi:predicted kinase